MKPFFFVVLMSTLLGSAVAADTLTIKNGKWETTVTQSNPMSGEPTTFTSTSCVELTEYDPREFLEVLEDCEGVETTPDGNKATFSMTCSMMGAQAQVDGHYELVSEAEGQGELDIQIGVAGFKVETKVEWQSRNLGECDE